MAALVRDKHSVLIAPNHADHADPHVLLRTGLTHNMRFHFMAAREGFEGSRFNAFILQRCGAFSVDREGADLASIKTALHILQQGHYPLVVFPEGEIWHHHEHLDVLNEGVATMILRAADKLEDGKQAYIVPTALRYGWSKDVASTFCDRVTALEQRIAWKPRPELDVVERIYRLGRGLLACKEEEFLGHAQQGTLVDRITSLREKLVEMIEAKHGVTANTSHIPERIKALRGRIRKRLTQDDEPVAEQEALSLYDDLDTLFVAVQLYSYPGQYLRDEPSMNRIAETILKLEEDVLGQGSYPADRHATVQFGEPIDIRSFLEQHGLTTKTAVAPLTELIGNRIQEMLS